MKTYLHSDGKKYLWPEVIPSGMEFVITPEFKTFWRKVNV
jgi:hypothetical protein